MDDPRGQASSLVLVFQVEIAAIHPAYNGDVRSPALMEYAG